VNKNSQEQQVDGSVADAKQEIATSAKVPDDIVSADEQLADASESGGKTLKRIDPAALAKRGAEAVQRLRGHGEELARQAADQAGKRADSSTRTAGEKLVDAAGFLREQETQVGPGAAPLDRVAGGLEQSGGYLQEHGVEGIRSTVLGLLQEHPVLSLLGACGLGYLLGNVAPLVQRGTADSVTGVTADTADVSAQ
jgi:hypothetical protein